jgi:flagellar motor switch protein FliM
LKDLDPRMIRTATMRNRVEKALDYKREIDALIGRQPDKIKMLLGQVVSETDQWLDSIYDMAITIDNFESNPSFQQDRSSLLGEIENLTYHSALETTEEMHTEIRKALEARIRLLNNMDSIKATIQQTEGKIDATLAQMREIYSKLQSLPSGAQ